jgi:tetratricopeptide (TPR) repeat protein
LEEALPFDRAKNDDSQLTISLSNLGYLQTLKGDYAKAKASLGEALQVTGRSDNRRGAIPCLCNLSDLALEEQDIAASASYAQRALAYAEELSDKVGEACSITNLGEIELRRGDLNRAETLLRRALAKSVDMDAGWMMGSILDLLAIVLWRSGDVESATLALVHRQIASSLPSPRRFAAEANDIYGQAEAQIGEESLARIRYRAEKSGVTALLDELPRLTARSAPFAKSGRAVATT